MERVLEVLRQRPERPLLVGIDGHSAAGKSTLARCIAENVSETTVVPMDDFYRMMPEEERFGLTPEEGCERYYDWQRLHQVLEALTAGRTSQYQRYDWTANRLSATVTVEPKGVILVEGCYSLRPELFPYYHVTFFAIASEKARLERQKLRADANEAWLAKWDAAEAYHFVKHMPEKAVDLVVYGDEVSA